MLLVSLIFSITLSQGSTPVELREKAKVFVKTANHLLGAKIRIRHEEDAVTKHYCSPHYNDDQVYLCNEFYDFIAKTLSSDEDQETALAFILSHEIMHAYFSFLAPATAEVSHQLAHELRIDPSMIAPTLYPFSHENVDWGATKLMLVLGYKNISPAIQYMNALVHHPHANFVRNSNYYKEQTLRIIHIQESYDEGLTGDQTYRKVISPCGDSDQHQLGSFLARYMTGISSHMLLQCEGFNASDIKSATGLYFQKLFIEGQ